MARDLNLRLTLQAVNQATGPLRQIMQGSQGAARAMRETRDQLRDLNAQQRQVTAFRDMSRQSHATRRALMDKREELRQISQQLQSTEGPTRRLTQQQSKAQREVDKLTREYRQQRDGVRDLARALPPGIDGTRGLTQQSEALARQIEATTRRLDAQRDALNRLARADVSGNFRNMTGEVRRFSRNVMFAGTAAGGAIFGLANSTAGLGDDVAKTADIMGIGIAELQELRYAAERAGVGTDGLDSSMQRMVRRIGRAAQGTGAAKSAYEELGLEAQALAKMRPEQALGVIADRLSQVEGQTNKVAFASAIWGNSGEAMLNMIQNGSAGLEDLRRQARDTGYVLSGNAARGSEDFKDALLDAQLSLKGMKNTIGAELMPAVTELMREFTGWMRSNRDEVAAFAREFGQRLRGAVPVIMELASGAASFASTLADLTTRAADLAGGFDNLALIVGGLFAAKAILSVIKFAIAIGKAGAALAAFAKTIPAITVGVKAIGIAFAALPIGWVVGGIAAVAGAATYLWSNWETIGPKFAALWQGIKDKASAAWEWLKGLFDWSPRKLIAGAWSGLGNIAGGAIESARGAASTAWEGIKAMFRWSPLGLIARAWQGLSNSVGSPIELARSAASTAWEGIKAMFRWSPLGLIARAWSGIGELVGSPLEAARSVASKAWAEIRAAFNDGIGGVTRLLANWSPLGILWRGISAALGTLGIELPATLTGLGGAIIDGLIGGIDAKWQALREKISGMASGITGWFKEKLGIASPSKVFAGFGANLLDGLINGIDEKWQLLKDKIGATAGAVTSWFKEKLGINSPSKVFAEFGVNTMQGYQQGLKTEEAAPLKEMDGFAKRLRQAGAGLAMGAAATGALAGQGASPAPDIRSIPLDTRPPMAAPAAGGGVTIQGGINIEIHATPGMDEQALAQLVGAEVQRALDAAARDAAVRRRSAFHDID